MKAIYNYIIAALVATLALASCTKDIPDTNSVDPQTEGERIIAVSFGNSTKTVLGSDGRTPQFIGGLICSIPIWIPLRNSWAF